MNLYQKIQYIKETVLEHTEKKSICIRRYLISEDKYLNVLGNT